MEIDEIDRVLIEIVEDFAQEIDPDCDITRKTRLVADMEFDSIDIIQFIVAVEKALGTRNLGFQQLLMADGRYVDDLTIGQVSDFLNNRRRKAG